MRLEAVRQKAMQGRAEALQHQTAEGWVDAAVSRQSLEQEEKQGAGEDRWEVRETRWGRGRGDTREKER